MLHVTRSDGLPPPLHFIDQRCLQEGAKVIATDLNTEKLQELKQEQPLITTDTLDVTCKEDVERLLKDKYSDVNVLFNCAG